MQVRSSVLVARTLIDEYATVRGRYLEAWRNNDETELSVFRAELERVYGAIWEQLDSAASGTEAAGRAIDAYLALRSDPALDPANAVKSQSERSRVAGHEYRGGRTWTKIVTTLRFHDNTHGLEVARRAGAALEAAWPELDWHDASADEPVPDLTGGGGKLARWIGRLFTKGR